MPNRIDTTLSKLREAGQAALAPYIMTGFPDIPTSESLARVLLESGGDMLEIGVPFSDPLADGPTVQMTSYRALQNGVTLAACIETVKNLREVGVESPLFFAGYYNPFLRYGLERFLDDSASAGVDGMIVPDLPTEEAEQLSRMAAERGIHLIPMLAPTSSDERIRDACQSAGGFIYCVSLASVLLARGVRPHSQPPPWSNASDDIPTSLFWLVSAYRDGNTSKRYPRSPTVRLSPARSWMRLTRLPMTANWTPRGTSFTHSKEQTAGEARLSKVRGLRGATTADANTKEAILDATRELLEKLVEANDVSYRRHSLCHLQYHQGTQCRISGRRRPRAYGLDRGCHDVRTTRWTCRADRNAASA